MTKEEFAKIVEREIEKLQSELATARQRVEFFRLTSNNYGQGKEYQEAQYQYQHIQAKINFIQRFVSLPAYARVLAMSDLEVEEYKQEKIEELDIKIKEVEAKVQEATTKLAQLKAEQESLIAKLGTLSGQERQQAIYRGQQINNEIMSYTADNVWGIFAKLQNEIEALKKQQEDIRTKTPQEIKAEIAAELKTNGLVDNLKFAQKPLEEDKELEAAIAGDPEKAQRVANLLAYRRKLIDDKTGVKGFLHIPYGIPKALEHQLTGSTWIYDASHQQIRDQEKIEELISQFEGVFEKSKQQFMSQFTETKMAKLVGKEYAQFGAEVDLEFLQLHNDKIADGELSRLESIVEQRDKLSKKLFKTKTVKDEIAALNRRIAKLQEAIYKEILGWYQSQSRELTGRNYGMSFYSMESLREDIERAKQDITRAEQSIADLKERVKEAKEKAEKQRQSYDDRIKEAEEQIRTIAGPQFREAKLPYGSDRAEYNLTEIQNAAGIKAQAELVAKVEQEAQNQADIKEAELRGITLEELIEMRKQGVIEQEEPSQSMRI